MDDAASVAEVDFEQWKEMFCLVLEGAAALPGVDEKVLIQHAEKLADVAVAKIRERKRGPR
jgi:hypothetical protein